MARFPITVLQVPLFLFFMLKQIFRLKLHLQKPGIDLLQLSYGNKLPLPSLGALKLKLGSEVALTPLQRKEKTTCFKVWGSQAKHETQT